MKTVGIIAEFNPFHNGHAYLIKRAREDGATHVVAVMSGSFVQRGEPAVFSTRSRAEAAVKCGADLVLQLPVAHVLSGARSFADSGIRILDACGIVDSVVFGSESGCIDRICRTAEILNGDCISDLICDELKKGITYAAARENALRKTNPELVDLISTPNNILGVEYISSIIRSGSDMKAETIGRIGSCHDSGEVSGDFSSASEIRRKIECGEIWNRFVPNAAAEVFSGELKDNCISKDKYEAAMLYRMRTASIEDLARLPDISEGLENRILNAVGRASSLESLYEEIKTKRYTLARIRRILNCALVGINGDDASIPAPYIRVLALNDRGAELLASMRTTAKLPVITKASDIKDADDDCRRMFELECRATDIRFSLTKGNTAAGEEKRTFPFKI